MSIVDIIHAHDYTKCKMQGEVEYTDSNQIRQAQSDIKFVSDFTTIAPPSLRTLLIHPNGGNL